MSESPEDPITFIKPGEPYAEEVIDPELARFNQLTARYAFSGLEEMKAFEAYMNSDKENEEQLNIKWMKAHEEQDIALAEFAEFVSSGAGQDTIGPGQ